MQEALHLEAVKVAVKLQVTPFGVAQVDQAGDELGALSAQIDGIDGGVMLHLQARFIRHAVATALGRLAQAQLAHPPGECGILHREPFFLCQLLMHALNPARTLLVQSPEQIRIDRLFVLADGVNHLALLLDHRLHGVAADPQPPGDLPLAHAFLVEQVNRFALVRFDHRVVSRYG